MAIEENNKNENSEKASSVIFKERFEIDFNSPIPRLDVNGATAYSVRDITSESRNLFALITDNDTPPRMSILPYLRSIEHPSVMRLIEFGAIAYKPKKTQNMALIYEKPEGKKLSEVDPKKIEEIKRNPEILKDIIISLYSAIETFRSHNITHRAIRLDNIFFKDDTYESVIVGDCVASFPAFYQPCVYETVESAIANKATRGTGNDRNDIYSAGVTLLSFFNKGELFKNKTDKEIIEAKLAKTSYMFLVPHVDFPKYLMTLFKGVLEDAGPNRWRYLQVFNFLEGKNYASSKLVNTRGKKSIILNGVKRYDLKEVVYFMINNVAEASNAIKTGKIGEWIKAGFNDEQKFLALQGLIEQEEASPTGQELFVAKVCILLAPSMPISFMGLSCFPQGCAKGIFYSIRKRNGDVNIFKDVFTSNLISFWHFHQNQTRSPSNVLEFKRYINNTSLGYGIERIMYDFDSDIPCNSPLLKEDFVNTAGRVLRSLNKNLKDGDPLFDKTIIAFLRCKLGKKISPVITDLNSSIEEVRILALLKLYTELQNKYGPLKLDNVTKKMAEYCIPLVDRFHNKSLRASVAESLKNVSKQGSLQKILEVLENKKALRDDKMKFDAKNAQSIVLNADRDRIITEELGSETFVEDIGIKISLIASMITAVISLVASLVVQVF